MEKEIKKEMANEGDKGIRVRVCSIVSTGREEREKESKRKGKVGSS